MEEVGIVNKDVKAKIISLTEAQSKKLLKSYGVPVVEETVALTIEEAVSQSGITGFPVVVKGLGVKLTHKTERGLVKLNLRSAEDVKSACLDIKKSAGDDLKRETGQIFILDISPSCF